MDKIKAIENEQLRANKLELNIGDTVKYTLKLKKETEKESKYSKEQLSKNNVVEQTKHSQLEELLTVQELKELS